VADWLLANLKGKSDNCIPFLQWLLSIQLLPPLKNVVKTKHNLFSWPTSNMRYVRYACYNWCSPTSPAWWRDRTRPGSDLARIVRVGVSATWHGLRKTRQSQTIWANDGWYTSLAVLVACTLWAGNRFRCLARGSLDLVLGDTSAEPCGERYKSQPFLKLPHKHLPLPFLKLIEYLIFLFNSDGSQHLSYFKITSNSFIIFTRHPGDWSQALSARKFIYTRTFEAPLSHSHSSN
jgi:hypothetical protein